MIPYILVTGDSREATIKEVNRMIEKGYRPLGGISLSVKFTDSGKENGREYAQAMVLMSLNELFSKNIHN